MPQYGEPKARKFCEDPLRQEYNVRMDSERWVRHDSWNKMGPYHYEHWALGTLKMHEHALFSPTKHPHKMNFSSLTLGPIWQHGLTNVSKRDLPEIARDCIFNVFLLWSISKLVNVKPHFSGGKTRVLWNRWSTVVVFQKSRFRFMIIFSHACFLTSSSESRGSTSSPLRVSLDLFEAKPNQV